jgi:hypothetical protein
MKLKTIFIFLPAGRAGSDANHMALCAINLASPGRVPHPAFFWPGGSFRRVPHSSCLCLSGSFDFAPARRPAKRDEAHTKSSRTSPRSPRNPRLPFCPFLSVSSVPLSGSPGCLSFCFSPCSRWCNPLFFPFREIPVTKVFSPCRFFLDPAPNSFIPESRLAGSGAEVCLGGLFLPATGDCQPLVL